MDRWEAQYTFWSGFGIPAYNELTSIDETQEDFMRFPYLSYEAVSGEIDQVATVNASLWYKDSSWKPISLKSDEIERAIGTGVTVPIDNGFMWVHKSNNTPFAQPADSGYGTSQVKRINLTVEIEFIQS